MKIEESLFDKIFEGTLMVMFVISYMLMAYTALGYVGPLDKVPLSYECVSETEEVFDSSTMYE